MSQPTPISKADAARLRGVSKPAVSQACRPGGALFEALLPNGRLDSSHPAFIAWLKSGGAAEKPQPVRRSPKEAARRAAAGGYVAASARAQRAPVPPKPAPEPDVTAWPPDEGPGSTPELQALSDEFARLIARLGHNHTDAVDQVDLWKRLEDILEKRIKNARARGELIAREHVKNFVIEPVNKAWVAFLRDLPPNLARTIEAMVHAGEPLEALEAEIRKQMAEHIKAAQSSMLRGLANAR